MTQRRMAGPAIVPPAEQAPRQGQVSIAGPEVTTARELAWRWRRATGKRALLVQVPLPGGAGRALRGGALTDSHPDVRGTMTFAAWLDGTRS